VKPLDVDGPLDPNHNAMMVLVKSGEIPEDVETVIGR